MSLPHNPELAKLVMAALNKERGYVVPPPLALISDPDDLFMGAFRLHGMEGFSYGLVRWSVRQSCILHHPGGHGALAPARVLAGAWHRLPEDQRWKLNLLVGADWSRTPYRFIASDRANDAELLVLRTLLVEQTDRVWGIKLVELTGERFADPMGVAGRFHNNSLAASILGDLPLVLG
jgi:hypothetical protein